MSLEPLPPNIERSIKRFAHDQHITHDEAVLKLIETGLTLIKSKPEVTKEARIPGLPAESMSDEDIAIFDEAMAIVRQARRQRSVA